MYHYLASLGLILLALGGWTGVQQLARRFAERHPETGPYRQEGGGCGLGCHCGGGACPRNGENTR